MSECVKDGKMSDTVKWEDVKDDSSEFAGWENDWRNGLLNVFNKRMSKYVKWENV